MGLVKLRFKSVSEIVGNDDVGLLVLVTEDERRQLTIVCDKSMVYQFGLRTANVPVKNKLLPEVLWQIVCRNVQTPFKVVINDLVDGQYKTLLYNTDILQAYPVRASDGVLLAYIAQMPVYIEEQLLLRQSVPHNEQSTNVSIPVNVLSDEMLQKALDKAISEENYEQASHLLEEQRRRERKEHKS
jgi:bifunctional DNase/RNase